MDKNGTIAFTPIGTIHSPFKEPHGAPIQSRTAQGVEGKVEVFQEYSQGLNDLDGFSHILLIYFFHLVKGSSLTVTPFLDVQTRGVFATRAPNRPNPIGFSIVELVKIEQNILHIRGLDIIDGTPLLDIKPCIPEFDHWDVKAIGWLGKNINKLSNVKDDGRFVDE